MMSPGARTSREDAESALGDKVSLKHSFNDEKFILVFLSPSALSAS